MHKKRILPHALFLVLFLIGIGAAAYPAFGNWYTEQKRSVVLTEYEKALAKIEDADLTDAFKQAEIYNDALFTGETDEEERPDYGELLCTTEDGIMGYVEIPSIQIRLPIYHGCTENELSKGAGHLPSSSLPVGGKSTHAVLAAHSGRADSKMFTDLDQVKEGNLVYLYVLNKTLTYEVDKITVTTPDDTDAIQIIDGKDLLTLLTCTPYGINTHRLLVSGHRVAIPLPAPDPADVRDERATELGALAMTIVCTMGGMLLCCMVVRSMRPRHRIMRHASAWPRKG